MSSVNWRPFCLSLNVLTWNRWQAIICTNDGQIYRFIYSSLGINELTCTAKPTSMAGHCGHPKHFAGLVVNYGISNTIVLEMA